MYLTEQQKTDLFTVEQGTIKDLSREWGVNYHSLRRVKHELKQRSEKQRETKQHSEKQNSEKQRNAEQAFNFPAAITQKTEDVLHIHDSNILVLGDIHAPFQNVDMLERAITITRKHFPHIRQVIIIGDLLDLSQLSTHLQNGPSTSAETDMKIGGKIVRELRRWFDDVYLINGNHDERISKRLNSEFSLESVLCGALGNMDAGLHISSLDYAEIGDDTLVGHPSLYSRKPAQVANKAALLVKKNVITGHSHKVGMTVSDDNEHWCIDNGHMAQADHFYYVKRRLNTFSKMGNGFTILSNGKPFIFGDAVTNWEFWMK